MFGLSKRPLELPEVLINDLRAVPLADGRYQILRYSGCYNGWMDVRIVENESCVLSALLEITRNLSRPVYRCNAAGDVVKHMAEEVKP
jgi:hypothetical protein